MPYSWKYLAVLDGDSQPLISLTSKRSVGSKRDETEQRGVDDQRGQGTPTSPTPLRVTEKLREVKTRWRDMPKFLLVLPSADLTSRLDPDFHIARKCLLQMLKELNHQSKPTLTEFMEAVDFMLDNPAAMKYLMKYRKPAGED